MLALLVLVALWLFLLARRAGLVMAGTDGSWLAALDAFGHPPPKRPTQVCHLLWPHLFRGQTWGKGGVRKG